MRVILLEFDISGLNQSIYWKELIGNRKEWNNLVGKDKTHTGL